MSMNGADLLNAAGARPYVRPVHMAKLISSEGDVSPLCAKSPRAIDLKKATWTNRAEAVTCRRCKSLLAVLAMPESDETATKGTGW